MRLMRREAGRRRGVHVNGAGFTVAPEQLLERCKELVREKKYNEAMELLMTHGILMTDGKSADTDPRLLEALADVSVRLGNAANAVDVYNALIEHIQKM